MPPWKGVETGGTLDSTLPRCGRIPMRVTLLSGIALLLTTIATDAGAIVGRFGAHVVRLEPNGAIEDFSDVDWGGGLECVLAIPHLHELVAVGVALEIVPFSKETLVFEPGPFEFTRELSTSQDFFRFSLGPRLGPHGHGFFQPWVGLHGGLVVHSVNTTLSIDFDDPSDDLSQTKRRETDTGVGYDVAAGVNLNFRNRFGVQGGVKYLHSFGLDEPIGEDRLKVDPEYFEAFAGISIDLGYLEELD
jgi:hypothetical protein